MFKALLNILIGGEPGAKSTKSTSVRAKSNSSVGSLRDLEDFVDYVVCALVDFPKEVKIRTEETDEGCSIQITCKKEDIGKIVGKRGKTIMAIRSLVSGAAGRQHKRVSVEVLD
ncbi:MAG: KH domain-containing protein [Victivallales bacterium]|jgi:predicted RNA-binding protein YlqC (UPF0109 family)|nr:KH domain-containing protein [Victivallales bacterium]